MHTVNIGIVVFIAVRVDLLIFAQKSPLVEGVLVWQVSSPHDLVLLRVEEVAALTAGSVFLAPEDQDLGRRNGARAEPILDVCL